MLAVGSGSMFRGIIMSSLRLRMEEWHHWLGTSTLAVALMDDGRPAVKYQIRIKVLLDFC